MRKPKKKAAARTPRGPVVLTPQLVKAINRGEIATSVKFEGTRLPVMPPFRSMTTGEILTWAAQVQRGTPLAHIVLGPVQWTIAHQPLPSPRIRPTPARRKRKLPRPTGRPHHPLTRQVREILKDKDTLSDRLIAGLANSTRPKGSRPISAKTVGRIRSTP
jgi:hypothetical protein